MHFSWKLVRCGAAKKLFPYKVNDSQMQLKKSSDKPRPRRCTKKWNGKDERSVSFHRSFQLDWIIYYKRKRN